MFGLTVGTYVAFLVTTFVIVVVPGPDHVYLGAVALRDGRRAGVIAAAGMAVAMTIHTLVAVTGVGAALAAVPAALQVIRLVGAAYLIHLGVTTLRSRSEPTADEPSTSRRVFTRAIVVNLTNPKIIIFFLAFLPQFVDARAGAVPMQLTVLGLSFVLLGLVVDVAYALAGGTVRRLLASRGTQVRSLGTVSGVVYIVLGVSILGSLALDAFT